MKIVLTVHQFLPDHASGTELLTLHTAQELQRRGHDVRIFTGYPAKTHLADDDRFDSYEYAGLPVDRFHHAAVPMGGQTDLLELEYRNDLFARHFAQYLARHKPDIVHFFHLYRLSASAIAAAVHARVPTVFTPTDFWTICPLIELRLPGGELCRGPGLMSQNCVQHLSAVNNVDLGPGFTRRPPLFPTLATAARIWAIKHSYAGRNTHYGNFVRTVAARHPYIRESMNHVDRILVPTKIMETLLAENGIDRARLRHVRYGIELQNIQRHPETKGTTPALRVGFIGTLAEHKGAHLLIDAVRALPPSVPIDLKIFGNPHEFPAYVARLHGLAADDPRIHFLGTFPNTQIGEVFSDLDVLVVPSIWYENTPLVIYSALAAAVPVIATNLGGMSEAITPEKTGLLFAKGDSAQLAAHLTRLAADRPFLRTLAANTPTPKSIPQYVTELEATYAEIRP